MQRDNMEQAMGKLRKQLMLAYPGIHRLEIRAAAGVSTLEMAEKALGPAAKDSYGAPYFVGSKPAEAASISSTEDGGWRLCLTAVHDKQILGIGIDYALTEEFEAMFDRGRYCAGRMFTAAEQAWMEKTACSAAERRQLLAELFSAKEAALKSLSNIIREKIPEDKAEGWRMEFKEFEIQPETDGRRRAVPFGKTAETVRFLEVRQIAVMTQKLWEGAVSVAVCLKK